MPTLEDVCSHIVDCKNRTAPIDPYGEYFAVGTPAMRGNVINFHEARQISAETFKEWTARLTPQEGDILFAREAPVGPVVAIPAGGNIAPGQRTMLLRADQEKADPTFLRFYLSAPQTQQRILGLAHGSTTPHLRVADVKAFEVMLPPLTKQKRIAEVLGALDDKIAANAKLAHTFEALGAAKFTRLGLDTEPVNGDGSTLDTLFDFNPRRTITADYPTVIDMQALPTSVPLIDSWTVGVHKGGSRFMNGDTLFARITPCLENRKTGFVDFLDDGDIGIGSTEFVVIRSKTGLPLSLSYFMAISQRFREFAIQNMVGTSGRQRVAATDLARHTVCRVDRNELLQFGHWADSNLKLLGSVRTENKALSEIRDALLPQLLAGKLEVKDAAALVEAAV